MTDTPTVVPITVPLPVPSLNAKRVQEWLAAHPGVRRAAAEVREQEAALERAAGRWVVSDYQEGRARLLDKVKAG
jgi:hypothetical protein